MLRLQKAYQDCSGKKKLHFIVLCCCFAILISLILLYASRNYSLASSLEHGQWYKTFKFACIQENCSFSLAEQPLEKRLTDLVLSPQFQLSDDQLALLHAIVSEVPKNDIIIASASSGNHFYELQAMFEALHKTVYPALKNFHVVLFDLGLKRRQRRLTEKFCQCQVLSFPFELFDPHVSQLHSYSWKPLIIRALMSRVRELLVYQDTSVRWTDQFQTVFERAKLYGQQAVGFPKDARIPLNTFVQMFEYMKEDICAYTAYPEILGGVHVLHKDPLIVQAVLNPWSRCALEKSCMCLVEDPETIIDCDTNVTTFYSKCHRFDQSAISIILSKLYASDRYRFLTPEFSHRDPKYVAVARGDKTRDYFKKTKKRKTDG